MTATPMLCISGTWGIQQQPVALVRLKFLLWRHWSRCGGLAQPHQLQATTTRAWMSLCFGVHRACDANSRLVNKCKNCRLHNDTNRSISRDCNTGHVMHSGLCGHVQTFRENQLNFNHQLCNYEWAVHLITQCEGQMCVGSVDPFALRDTILPRPQNSEALRRFAHHVVGDHIKAPL